MAFPAFFDQIPALRLRDPLAELLGTAAGGIIEYRYADAVRLAGHSCPTVAGAWLSAFAGLQALYPDKMPERGGISVHLPESEDAGVTGVIAQVLTLLTGAAANNGFKGLGGHYCRRQLLHFSDERVDGVQLRRNDSGAGVEVLVNLQKVPADPAQASLMQAVLQNRADAHQRSRFGELWQERVSRILLQHATDPEVIQVKPLH